MDDSIRKASDIIYKYLSNKRIEKADSYSSFFGSWQNVAGELAEYSQVIDIKNGSIIVETNHPAKMQLIQMSKRKIIYRVNKFYPELGIRDMVIRVKEQKRDAVEEYMADVKIFEEEKTEKDKNFKELLDRLGDLADQQS